MLGMQSTISPWLKGIIFLHIYHRRQLARNLVCSQGLVVGTRVRVSRCIIVYILSNSVKDILICYELLHIASFTRFNYSCIHQQQQIVDTQKPFHVNIRRL